jgi:acetylornithine deacetylase/succinyl-diaminopimelate desuccinylase-like protein
MTAVETLHDLVAINSVSERSNAEIISYLAGRCENAGLMVTRFPYHDDQGVEKINLVAQTSGGASDSFELALVGHTDTVPYHPDWIEALRLTEKAGQLLGRGACDTKAFIAAALTAIGSVNLSSLGKPLALVFTADEEIGCLGAKHRGRTHLAAAHARRQGILPGADHRARPRGSQRLSPNRRLGDFSRGPFDGTHRRNCPRVRARSASRF